MFSVFLVTALSAFCLCSCNTTKTHHHEIVYSKLEDYNLILLSAALSEEDCCLYQVSEKTQDDYLETVRSRLTGLKQLTDFSEEKKSTDGYRELKEFWMLSRYMTYDDAYHDLGHLSKEPYHTFCASKDEYLHGKGKFPSVQMKDCISDVAFQFADMDNHSYGRIHYAVLLECLVEECLKGIKSVDDVSDILTFDHMAGLIQIPSGYNDYYNISIALLESESGIYCNMWNIGPGDYPVANNFTNAVLEERDGITVYSFLRNDAADQPNRAFALTGNYFEEIDYG